MCHVKHSRWTASGRRAYSRKNWSSVVLWNWAHPANRRLTLEMVNTLPGRDLHAFCWLDEWEIGELPVEWNYLVGVTTARSSRSYCISLLEP